MESLPGRGHSGVVGSVSVALSCCQQTDGVSVKLGFDLAPRRMYWRQGGATLLCVPSIQVKGVPSDVHATLRRRAAAAGQSLQEYLLAQLVEDASTPTVDEVLERAGGRAGGRAGLAAAARAVRADRDGR